MIISWNNKIFKKYQKIFDKDKDGEDVTKLKSVEVVLVHCNLVNNNYQQASKVLFTFMPNKQFGQLINISLHSLTMLKPTSAEATSDLIGNKIADKITSLDKTKSNEKEDERQEIYTPQEKRQQFIDDLRLFSHHIRME